MPTRIDLKSFEFRFASFAAKHLPATADQYGEIYKFRDDSWAVGVDVIVNRDLPTYKVQVSWSSTHRTPVQAAAALVQYRKAVDFACQLQAFFDDYTITD
jgi:hypothetical protein